MRNRRSSALLAGSHLVAPSICSSTRSTSRNRVQSSLCSASSLSGNPQPRESRKRPDPSQRSSGLSVPAASLNKALSTSSIAHYHLHLVILFTQPIPGHPPPHPTLRWPTHRMLLPLPPLQRRPTSPLRLQPPRPHLLRLPLESTKKNQAVVGCASRSDTITRSRR